MDGEGFAALASRFLDPVVRYHDYQVVGIEHVPVTGPALVVLHHSLATYDNLLLALSIWNRTGRVPSGLGHDRLFEVPWIRDVFASFARPASPDAGRELLDEGHLVMVAPGGMREALRPSSERYQVRWESRLGFVRLALETQVPMVMAACPKADELFDIEAHPLTEWVYDNFRWPLPLLRGRRGWPVPRKVALRHHVAAPIRPPALDPLRRDAQIEALHEEATAVMTELLTRR